MRRSRPTARKPLSTRATPRSLCSSDAICTPSTIPPMSAEPWKKPESTWPSRRRRETKPSVGAALGVDTSGRRAWDGAPAREATRVAEHRRRSTERSIGGERELRRPTTRAAENEDAVFRRLVVDKRFGRGVYKSLHMNRADMWYRYQSCQPQRTLSSTPTPECVISTSFEPQLRHRAWRCHRPSPPAPSAAPRARPRRAA